MMLCMNFASFTILYTRIAQEEVLKPTMKLLFFYLWTVEWSLQIFRLFNLLLRAKRWTIIENNRKEESKTSKEGEIIIIKNKWICSKAYQGMSFA